MLRKVKLYGELAEFIGHKEFDVNVDTIGKAISFLIHNFPGVEAHMSPKYYQVKVGNYDLDKDELSYPIGKEDIHFIPVIAGAGRGGLGKILLGAALIGAAFMTGGVSFTFAPIPYANAGAITGITGTFLGKAAVYLGASLVLSGVAEMLFPLPKPEKFNSEEDPQLSFNFSGVQNTSRAGTPVPIVYGEIITGSVVISAAVDTNQVEA